MSERSSRSSEFSWVSRLAPERELNELFEPGAVDTWGDDSPDSLDALGAPPPVSSTATAHHRTVVGVAAAAPESSARASSALSARRATAWAMGLVRTSWRVAHAIPEMARLHQADAAMRRAINAKDTDGVLAALDQGASPLRTDFVPLRHVRSGLAAHSRLPVFGGKPGDHISLALGVIARWSGTQGDTPLPSHLVAALAEAMAATRQARPSEAAIVLHELGERGDGRELAIEALRRGWRPALSTTQTLRLIDALAKTAQFEERTQGVMTGLAALGAGASSNATREARSSCLALIEALLSSQGSQELLGALPGEASKRGRSDPSIFRAQIFDALLINLTAAPQIIDAVATRALDLPTARAFVAHVERHLRQPQSVAEDAARPESAQAALPRAWARLEQADLDAIAASASAPLASRECARKGDAAPPRRARRL